MWIEREITPELTRIAETFPVLALIGPRQVGKTSLLERTFPDCSYVSLDVATNAETAESRPQDFLKQYPPYPPGSEDRIKYLSRFAMLRKQIDQLTIPPDAGARSILGPSQDGSTQGWKIELGGQKISSTIRRQPVHTGPEGLALPEISQESTNEQIAGLQKALGQARRVLSQRRAGFSEDATRIIRSGEKMF